VFSIDIPFKGSQSHGPVMEHAFFAGEFVNDKPCHALTYIFQPLIYMKNAIVITNINNSYLN
jgi:hypothetical protein